ncbi:hypothetical protein [Streptomyces sp. NPDC050738]|uniref:hypothetical protein n=1 Tax=Streptomyces sp. NPDC050738 TaxID=3154744 RepID=UPI00342F071F
MRRLNKGAPIRAAMKSAGLDVSTLAAKTRSIDPDGKGLSHAYVGFISGRGTSSRETCSDRAATLIAAALDQEVTILFESIVFTLGESTSARTPRTPEHRTALPERLMDQPALAAFLRKSPSWIDAEIKAAKDAGGIWPGLIYVGSSRRFDPLAVLDAMRQQRASA